MAVAPPTMEFVPAKKKVAGWDSKDSLCEVYFASCERLGCTANSEVVRQLVRRAKLLAPLPTHRIEGLSRAEMLNLAFDHMDLDGSGTLSIPELVGFARGLNPIKVHGDVRAMIKQMDKDGDNTISRKEYLDAMRPIADALVDEEFQLGILETLASVPDIDDLPDRESKLAAVFRHLDVDGSGSLDQDELVAIFMDGADPDPAEARRNAEKQLEWLDTDADGVVSQVEFVEAMLFLHAYMSDEDFHAHCEEMMHEHKHVYDFSRLPRAERRRGGAPRARARPNVHARFLPRVRRSERDGGEDRRAPRGAPDAAVPGCRFEPHKRGWRASSRDARRENAVAARRARGRLPLHARVLGRLREFPSRFVRLETKRGEAGEGSRHESAPSPPLQRRGARGVRRRSVPVRAPRRGEGAV